MATLPGKSTTNAQSPGHHEVSEPTVNLNRSLRLSITDGMEESENSSCIMTKTSSLQAHYAGSQISPINQNGEKIDPENLGRQVAILRNKVDELLAK